MENIYTSGEYLNHNESWHAEDSPWKAKQIMMMMRDHRIVPGRVAEVGCGAGGILTEFSKMEYFDGADLAGYDISPQAIELARRAETDKVRFHVEDPLSDDNGDYFDVLLAIDVFEHVPDYLGFLERCRKKARFKIYHIPLDIHVSSVVRNTFSEVRRSIGHLHYFTADTAISSLTDSGHEVLARRYTDPAIALFKEHPSPKRALANVPRWLCSKISLPLSARLFGGYSLLVLAR